MSPLSSRERAERLKPETARSLQTVACAMAAGVLLLAGAVVLLDLRSTAAPAPRTVRLANALTALAMAGAFTAIAASELLWRRLLARADDATLDADVARAFVARSALREAAAVLGAGAALFAAQTGVLRAYPAYWADLAPGVLFWSYLYFHWPARGTLAAEAADALPSDLSKGQS